MKIQKLFLVIVVLAPPCVIAAAFQKNDAAEHEMKKLQGIWRTIKFIDHSEMEATPDEIKEWTFEFQGNRVVQRKDKDHPGNVGKYRLYPLKKPKWIDVNFGKASKGIYKLEGDRLTLCIVGGKRGGKVTPRPKEFKANKNPPYSLFVLKRVKDKKDKH